MRVLVIDDSRELVKLIKISLKRVGIEDVDGAYNFEEGLSKIQKNDYDVYIIDYHISFANGLELANIAKEKGKVIIMTGDPDFKSKQFTVFYKPFNLLSFTEYVRSLQQSRNP